MTPETLRARVLAEWRGLEEPFERRERCAPVGDILEKLMPRLGLGERLGEEQVKQAWSGIVGDFLASHASPAGLSGGVLSIQVLQPSVRYELERNWKNEILAKLQARFGKKTIREIKFRIS
jgi:predicted nucleic acid-binding Zn ribbon protein